MRGASQALSVPESRALARTFCPEGGGGARNLRAQRPGPSGSEEGSFSVGSGPGGLALKPPFSERFSSRLYSFICPSVIRWAGPWRGQRLETLRDGFLSTSLIIARDWALFALASPRGNLQPQGRVSGSGVSLLKLYLRIKVI